MIVTLNSDWLKQIKLNSASWLSLCGQKHRDNSQNIFLCSTEERKSYRFKNANIILAVLKRREENRK